MYRQRLHTAVGSTAGVLLQVFPELERILGASPSHVQLTTPKPLRFTEVLISFLVV